MPAPTGWDRELQFSRLLPDFEDWLEHYRRESDATRARAGPGRALAYGPDPAQRLTVHDGTPGAPAALVFLHGGYWRAFAAADYAFVQRCAAAAGAAFYNVDYRLMPTTRMPGLVADARRALNAAWADAAAHGARRLVIAGHSAGAHLACCAAAAGDPPVPADFVLVSGIYDLGPVSESFLQAELALTRREVETFSPLRAVDPPEHPQLLVLGGDETSLYRAQAQAWRAACNARGGAARLIELPGLHHMAIVAELGRPGSALFDTVAAMLVSA